MKALSIRQPWAWAIIYAGKDIENRTWTTLFKGEFLIHASGKFDLEGYSWLIANKEYLGITCRIPEPYEFFKGGFVGVARVIGCTTAYSSAWFSGPFGFIVKNPRPIAFYKYPGQLKFFSVPDDVIKHMKQA